MGAPAVAAAPVAPQQEAQLATPAPALDAGALQLVTLLERDRTAAVQLLDKWTRERTLTSTEAGDLRRALVALLGGL